MNKQPFYHRVDGLLFTATRSLSEAEIVEAVSKIEGVVPGSTEIEPGGFDEPEAGDPADLC